MPAFPGTIDTSLWRLAPWLEVAAAAGLLAARNAPGLRVARSRSG
jgi:hypothetical protein